MKRYPDFEYLSGNNMWRVQIPGHEHLFRDEATARAFAVEHGIPTEWTAVSVPTTIYQVYEEWTDYDGWKRSEPRIILTTFSLDRAVELVAADGFRPWTVGARSSSKPQGTRGDLMNRSVREVTVEP